MTQLLHRWSSGDDAALAELTPLVYEELRRLAHHYMEGQRPDHTLQTTALESRSNCIAAIQARKPIGRADRWMRYQAAGETMARLGYTFHEPSRWWYTDLAPDRETLVAHLDQARIASAAR